MEEFFLFYLEKQRMGRSGFSACELSQHARLAPPLAPGTRKECHYISG